MRKVLAALVSLCLVTPGFADDWSFKSLNPTLPQGYYIMEMAGLNDQGHVAFLASGLLRTQDLIIVLDENGRQHITPVPSPNHAVLGGIAANDLVGGLLFNNTSDSYFLFKKNKVESIPDPGFGFQMGGLNDHGDFTIGSHGPRGQSDVGYYANGKFTRLSIPGETSYSLTGISNDDTMVGNLPDSGRSFIYKHGKCTFFTVGPGVMAWPQAISDNGQYVAGYCETHGGNFTAPIFAFIRNRAGDIDLIQYPQAPSFAPSGGSAEPLVRSLTYVYGVNDRGEVSGMAFADYLTPEGGVDSVTTYFTAKRRPKP